HLSRRAWARGRRADRRWLPPRCRLSPHAAHARTIRNARARAAQSPGSRIPKAAATVPCGSAHVRRAAAHAGRTPAHAARWRTGHRRRPCRAVRSGWRHRARVARQSLPLRERRAGAGPGAWRASEISLRFTARGETRAASILQTQGKGRAVNLAPLALSARRLRQRLLELADVRPGILALPRQSLRQARHVVGVRVLLCA